MVDLFHTVQFYAKLILSVVKVKVDAKTKTYLDEYKAEKKKEMKKVDRNLSHASLCMFDGHTLVETLKAVKFFSCRMPRKRKKRMERLMMMKMMIMMILMVKPW